MEKLDFIYKGGVSKRFHVEDTLRTQNIAEHSFGVAWLCEVLMDGMASKDLIMAAMSHDLAEHRTGDIPSPAKRRLGISKQFEDYEMAELRRVGLGDYLDNLTEGEELTMKVADIIEGMMFCLRERRLGNQNVLPIYGRFKSYIGDVLHQYNTNVAAGAYLYVQENAVKIIDHIEKEWNKNEYSERTTNSGGSLQIGVPALGLGCIGRFGLSAGDSDQILDPVEKEKRPSGHRKI